MTRNTPQRTAMYYPRIHLPEIEWVKATLLSFGRIYRIVPHGHPLFDPPEIAALSTWDPSDTKKLVVNVDPEHPDIELAQASVFSIVAERDGETLRQRFGLASAMARSIQPFELHRSKVHNGLLDRLEEHQLVWPATLNAPDSPFVGIHPDLGEAILGVSAICTAQRTGSDVVTNESSLHSALAAVDAPGLLRSIFHPSAETRHVDPARATTQLVHAVLTTHFDLSRVELGQVVELAQNGTDLRAFRSLLLSFAEQIPPELDQEARAARIENLTHEVIVAWQEFERRLGGELKATFKSAVADSTEELVVGATTSAATLGITGALSTLGPATIFAAIVAFGVPIGFKLLRRAFASKREGDEPNQFRFLSRVTQHGGSLLEVPRLYRPSIETPASPD